MPSRAKISHKNQVKIILLILFSLILLGLGFCYWVLYQSGKGVYELRRSQVEALMQENPVFFTTVFTEIFPKALECQQEGSEDCASQMRPLFEGFYVPEGGYHQYMDYEESRGKLRLVGSLPLYFIKLENNQIAKLFLSGNLKIEDINTRDERLVRDVLLGKRERLFGIQANDDWFRMTYLNDFLSEAEVIVPVRQHDEVIGAVVFLHGD